MTDFTMDSFSFVINDKTVPSSNLLIFYRLLVCIHWGEKWVQQWWEMTCRQCWDWSWVSLIGSAWSWDVSWNKNRVWTSLNYKGPISEYFQWNYVKNNLKLFLKISGYFINSYSDIIWKVSKIKERELLKCYWKGILNVVSNDIGIKLVLLL